MILCPSCSADMRFSPEKQLLVCDYCGCEQDPTAYADSQGLGAKDSEYFETTIFSCPQCGGDIMSTSDTAATFCSYCGASVMLNARLSKEKCPDFMIPFKIGKGACKEAYKKTIKNAIFAPKALRADTEIEKFRGIYMPYWSYNMDVNSLVIAPGEKSHREGDYIVTRHYNVSAPVKGTFEGIAFDAASSFSDNLSEGIAPFEIEATVPFNPAYLSGFYADNGDVNAGTYQSDAKGVVKDYVGSCVSKTGEFVKFGISGSAVAPHVPVNGGDSKSALYPVWFLSNRTGDRITYAVVNGQTGKVAADIPVDPKKYLLATVILTIPLFLLLNMVFTFTPSVALIIAIVMDIISMAIYYSETGSLDKKESGESDKGQMSLEKMAVSNQTTIHEKTAANGKKYTTNELPKFKIKKSSFNIKKILAQLIALVIGALTLFSHPVRDMYYYVVIVGIMIVTAISFVGIIKQYNLLTTRKLPQLGNRGGDEHAEI